MQEGYEVVLLFSTSIVVLFIIHWKTRQLKRGIRINIRVIFNAYINGYTAEPKLDELLRQARRIGDDEMEEKIWKEMQRVLPFHLDYIESNNVDVKYLEIFRRVTRYCTALGVWQKHRYYILPIAASDARLAKELLEVLSSDIGSVWKKKLRNLTKHL